MNHDFALVSRALTHKRPASPAAAARPRSSTPMRGVSPAATVFRSIAAAASAASPNPVFPSTSFLASPVHHAQRVQTPRERALLDTLAEMTIAVSQLEKQLSLLRASDEIERRRLQAELQTLNREIFRLRPLEHPHTRHPASPGAPHLLRGPLSPHARTMQPSPVIYKGAGVSAGAAATHANNVLLSSPLSGGGGGAAAGAAATSSLLPHGGGHHLEVSPRQRPASGFLAQQLALQQQLQQQQANASVMAGAAGSPPAPASAPSPAAQPSSPSPSSGLTDEERERIAFEAELRAAMMFQQQELQWQAHLGDVTNEKEALESHVQSLERAEEQWELHVDEMQSRLSRLAQQQQQSMPLPIQMPRPPSIRRNRNQPQPGGFNAGYNESDYGAFQQSQFFSQ